MSKYIKKIKDKYLFMAEPAKASLWYTLSNVILKGIALLATPVFTRILTQEQFGKYTLFQTWYSVISIFTTLNLFQSVYSKGLILYEKDEKRFTSSMLGLSTSTTIIMLFIYLIGMTFWSEVLKISPTLMLAMFFEIIAMSAVEFFAAKEKFNYKYKKYVMISLLTTFLSVIFGVIVVVITDKYKVEARVFADVISKAIFGIPLLIYIFIKGKCVFDKKYWIYALKFNIPLLPHFLSTFILNQADRIMIGEMSGNDKAGIYGIAYTVATMTLLVITAINNAVVPYIYKMINAHKYDQIKKNTTLLFVLALFLSIITMILAPDIILIFGGKAYYEAIWIVAPVATSIYFIFVYSMFSTVEYYFQKAGLMSVASVVSAIINILLNYIFIEGYGYFAAGYTTLICYILLSLFHYYYYRNVLNKNGVGNVEMYNIKIVVICSIIVIATMLFMLVLYKTILLRYFVFMVILIVSFVKRKNIISSIKRITKV